MQTVYLHKTFKDARLRKGLSQEALSEETNISLRTIQRIEKGDVKPRLYTMKVLCEGLDIDLANIHIENKVEATANEADFDVKLIKKMNRVILMTMYIPFLSVLASLFLKPSANATKELKQSFGKLLSFQFLWSIITIVLFFASIMLNNMITRDAGNALFVSSLTYMLCIIANITVLSLNSIEIEKGNRQALIAVPNFF